MIVIGFDVGLTGAFSILFPDSTEHTDDLPTIPLDGLGLIRSRLDGGELIRVLERELRFNPSQARAVIEQVGAIGGFGGPKNNAVQIPVSLGRSLGHCEAACGFLNIPITYVQPQAWKAHYGIDSSKTAALNLARTLYPDAPLKLAKHHNRAESLLIARYGQRKLFG